MVVVVSALAAVGLLLGIFWRRRRRHRPSGQQGFIAVIRSDGISGHRRVGPGIALSAKVEGRDGAEADLRGQAIALGANAVVGLRFEIRRETYRAGTGRRGNPYYRSRPVKVWSGTAVTLLRPRAASDALLAAIQPGDRFVVDGSNVMHWSNGEPDIADVDLVVRTLRARRARVHVFFDANAGYRLTGRYAGDSAFALALGLDPSEVTVVGRGVVADRPLLDLARRSRATVVTRDLFRDHDDLTPDVPILLGRIEGGSVLFREREAAATAP